MCCPRRNVVVATLAILLLAAAAQPLPAQAPVLVQTNVSIRVMAANTTSGNFQRYEGPGMRIFAGLKPDIVAVQEFNYASTNGAGTSSPGAIREMVNSAFGTNFHYFREPSGYSIPNGIISRWPILGSDSWDDVQVPDRGFAWARIDIPGTNDLYVVSVHLHSSGGPSSRAIEATNLSALIQSNFPANAYLVVAGDFNTDTSSEAVLAKFKTYLSDNPIPTDAVVGGKPETNAGRTKRYDYALPSFTLATNQIPVTVGSKTYPNGLVFDSRGYSPIADVAPVLDADSGASMMQHMAVVKDFRIPYTVTNLVTVPRPSLALTSTNQLRWRGLSNVTYTVHAATHLTNWSTLGTATSPTTNLTFNIPPTVGPRRFFRVTYP